MNKNTLELILHLLSQDKINYKLIILIEVTAHLKEEINKLLTIVRTISLKLQNIVIKVKIEVKIKYQNTIKRLMHGKIQSFYLKFINITSNPTQVAKDANLILLSLTIECRLLSHPKSKSIFD